MTPATAAVHRARHRCDLDRRARHHPARLAAVPAAGLAAVLLAGCTGASGNADPTTPASTVVVTSTAPATSIAPVSEAPVSPAAPVQEVSAPNNACPYITNDAARQAEGDRVGRVTLTTSDPVGCNFYWQYADNPMILQISVVNYPSQTGAYNAMIRDTVASPERLGVQGLIPKDGCDASTAADQRPTACVDAVLFRTTFYPPDGNTDWACSFATNSKVVTVRTRQNDTSFNARNVATQIAAQF